MLVQNIGHDCSNITSETVMTLHWEIQNSSFEKQRAYLPDNQSFLSGRHLIVTNNMSETIIDIKFICTQWAEYPAMRSNGPLPQVRDGKRLENIGDPTAGRKSSSPIIIKIEEEEMIPKNLCVVLFPNALYFADLYPLHEEGQKGQICVFCRDTD